MAQHLPEVGCFPRSVIFTHNTGQGDIPTLNTSIQAHIVLRIEYEVEMTGIFTYKQFALSDTPNLDGKVAVVTVCVIHTYRHLCINDRLKDITLTNFCSPREVSQE